MSETFFIEQDIERLKRKGKALSKDLLTRADIKGTTQSIVFNGDGTVQKIQHKDSTSTLIREDVFTYASNLITEIRTLTSGGSLTYKYHLDSLQTEVI